MVYQECAICLEPVKKTLQKTACGHCFHSSCLNTWTKIRTNCPICRADIKRLDFEDVINQFKQRLEQPERARVTISNNTVFVEDDDVIFFRHFD